MPFHSHDAFEMYLCVQNNYEIHANNKEYILQEGDILIIPPRMLHEYINDKYGVRFIYLIEMNQFFKSQDYKTIEPLLFDAFLVNNKPVRIYMTVYKLFMEMNSVYFTNANFWETIIYDKMYQVFIEIAKHSENSVKAEETQNTSQSINRINALLRYLDINYAEDISTEQAAEYTGFSKYHFIRLFKLQTGYTFHDYLTLKRISMAEELLITDMPITDIAFQTGFNTLPSFCRTFKKYTNYSPSDYKKDSNTLVTIITEYLFSHLHYRITVKCDTK